MSQPIASTAESADGTSRRETSAGLDAVSSTRSLILLAIGALTGLALAGYALFTAKGTSTLFVPSEYAAVVNHQPISRTDFLAQLQALYGADLSASTPAQRKTALDGMIREELFVQRGRELDVAAVDADVRSATVVAVGQIVAADAIASVPTDAQLRAYYDAHKSTYASEGSIRARDIVFADKAKAIQARGALRGGATIAAVAQQFGGRISEKLDGEDFYFAAKIHLGDRLFAVARALGDGAVSEPIAARDGFHLIAKQKNNRPLPFTFSEVQGQVLTDFRAERIARIQSEEEKFLRKRADIVIAEDLR